MENKLTILTTTYNRPDKLERLFNSLEKQSNKKFCWWIVNDGSTRSYKEIENVITQKNCEFEVHFFKKSNGGKHRALNFIIPKVTTEYTMIIDDDDYLVANAVETVLWYSDNYLTDDNNLKSIIFERAKNDEITPMSPLPQNIDFGQRFQYIVQNRINGDFTDVFLTKALKEFRLPEFAGENFISEGPLYFLFSQKYESVFIKKIVSVGDYNAGGLSSNVHRLMAQNIKGSMYELKLFLSVPTPLYYRIKKGLLYGYLMKKNKKNMLKSIVNAPSKLTSLLTPFGYVVGYFKN